MIVIIVPEKAPLLQQFTLYLLI